MLERDIGLRTFIESGVRLDSEISRDLLLSIFKEGNPLHDGAVIVQKGRLAAAACFLPLTVNPLIASSLGTRHRAGIGITEETDCLAIMVSEETGTISVSAFGEIQRGLTIAQVDERIYQHFDVSRKTKVTGAVYHSAAQPASQPATQPAAAESATQPLPPAREKVGAEQKR